MRPRSPGELGVGRAAGAARGADRRGLRHARRPAIPAARTIATASGSGSNSRHTLARTRRPIISEFPLRLVVWMRPPGRVLALARRWPRGAKKESQGGRSPWLRLNLWRYGSRSRADAAVYSALSILDPEVLPSNHNISSTELAAQDNGVTVSVGPPLPAEAPHFAEFGFVVGSLRGLSGPLLGACRTHLSIKPPGSSEGSCSTFDIQTHSRLSLPAAQGRHVREGSPAWARCRDDGSASRLRILQRPARSDRTADEKRSARSRGVR